MKAAAPGPSKAPLWLLVMVTISGTLAMHMFVPALPAVAHAYAAPAASVQLTISLYIIGLACGQLIYGPLADALGRRPMLMAGLALYTLAGLLAALAPNLPTLVAARLLQALGGCAGLALGRAIVRDTSAPAEAVRDLALLNLMMMIGPGISPLIGSAINATFGWRAIFVALCSLGALTVLLSWRLLPETGKPTGNIRVRALAGDYRQLLRMPTFVGFTIGGGCATTAVYGFIAAAPFIISVQLHRPLHEVGIYIAMVIVGMSVGNFTTRQLVRSVPLERLMMIGNALCTASALTLLATVLLNDLNLVDMTALMFVFACGAGMASPAALAKALSVDIRLVGSAAGCYGFLQMAVGAACSALVGIGSDPALATAIVLTGATLTGQCGFWFAMHKEKAARKLEIAAQAEAAQATQLSQARARA